jgi:hypothetical protein
MQPVRFCSKAGCFEVAIKTARTDDLCRKDYRADVLAVADDLVRAEVLCDRGSRGEDTGVTDAVTNQTVYFGGVVTLDPRETNLAALVAGGIVKILPSAAAEAVKAEA